MKKILIALLCGMSVLVGCGNTETKTETKQNEVKVEKKEYKPKEIANYNTAYVSKTDKNSDGTPVVINITSIEKKDNDIIINVNAPGYDQLKSEVDNFLAFNLKNSEGKIVSDKLDKIFVNPVNDDNTQILISCTDATDINWIEIMPFKTSNNNFITFEIK